MVTVMQSLLFPKNGRLLRLPRPLLQLSSFRRCTLGRGKNGDPMNRVYTVPNFITATRIISSPLLGTAIALDMKEVALAGCLYAALSDWADGYLAKRYSQQSHLGSLLDPVADKLVIGALTVGLTAKGLVPLSLCGIIVGRDLLLIGGAFWVRYRTIPAGADFFDYTHPSMFSIKPSFISRLNTGLQFTFLFSTLGVYFIDTSLLTHLAPLWYITGASTLVSGFGYVRKAGLEKRDDKKALW